MGPFQLHIDFNANKGKKFPLCTLEYEQLTFVFNGWVISQVVPPKKLRLRLRFPHQNENKNTVDT